MDILKGKRMKSILEKIIEDLSDSSDATWSLYGDKGSFEISTYSPAGENVIIAIEGTTLSELEESAREAWEWFDAEKHAAKILIAKRAGTKEEKRFFASAPDSLKALLEDANAIDRVYQTLYAALQRARKENTK